MNHRTNQKAWGIMKPLSVMDPPDIQGQNGGREAKWRPWQFQLPFILLLVITLPKGSLITTIHWTSSGMLRMMMKMAAYFKEMFSYCFLNFFLRKWGKCHFTFFILKRRQAEATTKSLEYQARVYCSVISGESLGSSALGVIRSKAAFPQFMLLPVKQALFGLSLILPSSNAERIKWLFIRHLRRFRLVLCSWQLGEMVILLAIV